MFYKLAHRLLKAYWFVVRPLNMGVKLMLIQDETILLVKHTYQPGWFLPGGGVKRGEMIEQAAYREAAEEVGATLDHLQFFGLYTGFQQYKSDHIAVFLSNKFSVAGPQDYEIEAYHFFALDNLPPDTSPACQRRITEYLQKNASGYGLW